MADTTAADGAGAASSRRRAQGLRRRLYADSLYHERQRRLHCALHAVNNLLQVRHKTRVSLSLRLCSPCCSSSSRRARAVGLAGVAWRRRLSRAIGRLRVLSLCALRAVAWL